MDPDNYRGISVISCLSKFLLLILNQRLSSFFDTYRIINRSQIGFQKAYIRSHFFSEKKTSINKHISSVPRGKIYMYFVDFKKAYNSVWQKGLFAKLEALKINGPWD